MSPTISRKVLCGYLSLLRETLCNNGNFPPAHVIFFDSRSFYCYFSKRTCGDSTVGEILAQMENCIPLAITRESFSLFLSACHSEETSRRTRSFLESAKADFLLLLHNAAMDEGKWQAVTMLCEDLRQKNRA